MVKEQKLEALMDEENSIDRQLEAKAEKLAPVLRTNDLMFQ